MHFLRISEDMMGCLLQMNVFGLSSYQRKRILVKLEKVALYVSLDFLEFQLARRFWTRMETVN